ncbi:MAG: hypothetical protein LBS03_05655 [Bacteroidales bacterium]|nr:hypothetical protein [Bacteroidales bacterium]
MLLFTVTGYFRRSSSIQRRSISFPKAETTIPRASSNVFCDGGRTE